MSKVMGGLRAEVHTQWAPECAGVQTLFLYLWVYNGDYPVASHGAFVRLADSEVRTWSDEYARGVAYGFTTAAQLADKLMNVLIEDHIDTE